MTAPKCLRNGHDWYVRFVTERVNTRVPTRFVIECDRCGVQVQAEPVTQ